MCPIFSSIQHLSGDRRPLLSRHDETFPLSGKFEFINWVGKWPKSWSAEFCHRKTLKIADQVTFNVNVSIGV